MANQPPEYLTSILMSIESVSNSIFEEFPKLSDKDVEWAYEKLKSYYSSLSKGKAIDEPLANTDRKQALIDEILNILELREEDGVDNHLINNAAVAPGGAPFPNLAALYVTAFNYLRRSARLWRKEMGPQGYLKYIHNFLSSGMDHHG